MSHIGWVLLQPPLSTRDCFRVLKSKDERLWGSQSRSSQAKYCNSLHWMQCSKYLTDQRKKMHLLASSPRHHCSFLYRGLPQCLIGIAYTFHPEVTDPVLFTIWSGSPSECKKNAFLCCLEAQHVHVTCFDQWQMSGRCMYCIKMEHFTSQCATFPAPPFLPH